MENDIEPIGEDITINCDSTAIKLQMHSDCLIRMQQGVTIQFLLIIIFVISVASITTTIGLLRFLWLDVFIHC